jgi:hypothetical protein
MRWLCEVQELKTFDQMRSEAEEKKPTGIALVTASEAAIAQI